MSRRPLPIDEFNLTEREHQVLDYLAECILGNGYPPTVREICDRLDIRSTSTIHRDLASLQQKGFIRKNPAKPRAIEILKNGRNEDSSLRVTDKEIQEYGSVLEVPLVGQVAAGMPILAEQNINEYFPVPASYVNGSQDHFMLKVKGESMVEVGILDGDLILVRCENDANNGDIVVAMIDGFESEATVKTFYREEGHIRLQPENHTMSPIIVHDVTILGKVKGVFRYL